MAGEGTSGWQRLQLCLEGQTNPLRAGHQIRQKTNLPPGSSEDSTVESARVLEAGKVGPSPGSATKQLSDFGQDDKCLLNLSFLFYKMGDNTTLLSRYEN